MKLKPLPIGVDNFQRMISGGYYYVDKTLLIKELLDNKASVNLFTRPRRFGKTLNISMLQYFFEDRDEDNSYLFDGLKIMEQGEAYTKHIGQYPVINISLKSAKQPDFDFSYSMIARRISEEFKRHEYILEDERLNSEKDKYLKLAYEKGEQKEYADSLLFLSQCLEKYHERKVVILIDEYDVPLENSYFRGFYTEMIDFIRALFESSLKTISILNSKYAGNFGFEQSEVTKMLLDYNLSEKENVIKDWYNGYTFGETNVYNPWSLIQYVDDLKSNNNTLPSSYWANTSSNSIVRSLIEKADLSTTGLKKKLRLKI